MDEPDVPMVVRDRWSAGGQGMLARLGIAADTAVPQLHALGLWGDEGPAPDAEPLVEALARTLNVNHALPLLARLAEAHPDGWASLVAGERAGQPLVTRAATVAGASRALGELLADSPAALSVLTGELEPWHAATVQRRAAAELRATPEDAARRLAAFQRRGLLRVAARDLLGLADTPTTAAELADLAEGILAAALDHLVDTERPDARVAVIGMGKLGGRELNYVSDVDVMFVGDGDLEAARRVAAAFLRLLGETTPEGRAYEVDANLRPEGKDGPLLRSLEAYLAYYERWAKAWEFQALLKARHVAGDARLGRDFVEATRPFVWPDRLEAEAVAEIQRMKGVVESSREVQRAGNRQVKLAPGGIRDIEFAVQLLQLVHGRYDETLRSGNTLEALQALAAGGYVDEGDANLASDAYQFLRTVEHRLQLYRLRRTHTVPADDEERGCLARNLGFHDLTGKSALQQFDKELARVQGYVRRLHEKLFYRPLLERFAELSRADQVVGGPDGGGLDDEAARDRLAALGFADAGAALEHLRALASGVSRGAQLFRMLLPALLPTLAAAPDPDGGLAAFHSLADRLGGSPVFLRSLRDTPPVGEMLAQVLGRSQLVGQWLERQPEVIGYLADLSGLGRRLESSDYLRLAEGLRRRGQDEAASSDALRRLKRREVARIAVRDLTGQADVVDVAAELSALAEACLERAVSLVVPSEVRMAVVALGKLGGRELGYASDLDVLLVFEPAEHREEALKAVGRLLPALGDITPEGQAFRVDLNLRPEGKDGPLARTLDSYRSYYERWGEHWELQALTQARPVAGDRQLGAAFVDAVTDLVYPKRPPPERVQAVRRMKARVERERGAAQGDPVRAPAQRRAFRPGRPPPARPVVRPHPPADRPGGINVGDRVDLKLGPGGLSDAEWTVQLLQLQLGGHRPSLRTPGTLAAVEALAREGVIDGGDARWLREGYSLLARIRNMLYLGGLRRTDELPPGPRDQERIARMLGHPAPGAQAFVEELGRAMRRVRKVHERYFYDA
ncbi:MAG TPA: bifunctional [glutamine synthetase] adenylyltransferase/[glutamine synthetase]-adenylyl-L-tyrosine phosphorylase [Egibacteraceae bacterium]|nr:bifunctional [glutamine synthetase] adenylyltransferase/[glutamine synthetase]-adenylyl-L-tyrosine phosphorylase [Egibacteraceae bacterium]